MTEARSLLVNTASATLLLIATLAATDALADTMTVCSSGCDYTSIQGAVDAASSGDTIELGAETFIENVIIEKDLSVAGQGRTQTIVDGNSLDSVFSIRNAEVILSNLTVQNGNHPWKGGGVDSVFGDLTVNDCLVRDNNSGGAGGISSVFGALMLMHDTVTRNNSAGSGGGVGSRLGSLSIESSEISYNTSDQAGGVAVLASSVLIVDSRIVGNSAADSSGGIHASVVDSGIDVRNTTVRNNTAGNAVGGMSLHGSDSDIAVRDTTIADNTAGWAVGGMSLSSNFLALDRIVVTNCTISGNSAQSIGGVSIEGGILRNTTIAYNTSHDFFVADGVECFYTGFESSIIANNERRDCRYNYHNFCYSLGHNLSSDTSCLYLSDPTDYTNTDPSLLPLADNGGPTLTHALDAGSPAMDAGGLTCEPTDQRGVTRPQDGDSDGTAACDIGAFEVEPEILTVEIDIIPRVKQNAIDLSLRRSIPVAVLGSEDFDVTAVDVATLQFGPKQVSPLLGLDRSFPQENFPRDVNGDGCDDLTAWFLIQGAGIACGDESAELRGETKSGATFQGSDSIKTINCDTGEYWPVRREFRRPSSAGDGLLNFSRPD